MYSNSVSIMDQPSTSERTPLVANPRAPPTYVFNSASARFRKEKLRKLQCCICSTLLFIFTVALVVSISYSIEHPDLEPDNSIVDQGNTSIITLLQLSWPRPDTQFKEWPEIVTATELKAAEDAGTEALNQRKRFEDAAFKSGSTLRPGSAAHRAQRALAATPPADPLAKAGYAKDYATKYLLKNKSTGRNWSVGKGPRIDAEWNVPECRQLEKLNCPPSRYRSINGTCNNLNDPYSWGVSFTPFRRVLAPDYSDGVSAPRAAQDGSLLPSARQVSLQVHRPVYRADPDFTVVLAVWGQFLDHDITATALSQSVNGTSISCCEAYETPGLVPHPECFPVPLSPEDPNYNKYNITCMEFVRSAPAPACHFGPREQLNQATSFIDGSTVYGPYDDLAKSLRTFVDGELTMLKTPDGRELLPQITDPNDGCNDEEMAKTGKYCFLSGDSRANENLHLTTMHLLLARHHNRLTRRLKALNPHWDDQTLYEEARRVVAAQMQHITYNEFLYILLGSDLMDKLDLTPQKTGYYNGYDSSLDPSIANHFASSAFRFAHTLLPTLMKVANGNANSPEYIHLHKMLFNPFSLYMESGVDNAIKGAMQTDMQKVDAYFTPELTTNLFKSDTPPQKQVTTGNHPKTTCGLDLVSLNIQRGRDHGLPSYPSWRKHCGFKEPKSFDDLKGVVDPDSLQRIKSIYKKIEDVDLYTAALSEVPLPGRVLGATITCLLADQFIRLKRGDRYWYENPEKPQAFTPEQLQEIRKTTLAGIICHNGDSLTSAQRYVMRSIGPDNPLVRCSAIPDLDLSPWAEDVPKVQLADSQNAGVFVIKPKPE